MSLVLIKKDYYNKINEPNSTNYYYYFKNYGFVFGSSHVKQIMKIKTMCCLLDFREIRYNGTETKHHSKRGRQKSSPCLITSLITTNNLGRWSPMESGNFFLHISISLSSFSLLPKKNTIPFITSSNFPSVVPFGPHYQHDYSLLHRKILVSTMISFFGSLPCLPSDRFFSSRFTLTAK